MEYIWSGWNKEMENLGLDIYDVNFKILENKIYSFNGETIKGAIGKTCWYMPLGEKNAAEFGVLNKKCGIKIIKYPVFNNMLDEYHRLQQEFTIQKITYENNLTPDIMKICMIKNIEAVSYTWLSEEIVFPEGSICFALIVEHLENKSEMPEFIGVNSDGDLFGKQVDDFVDLCLQLRIVPYDLNIDNMFWVEDKLMTIDVHKWKRTYSIPNISAPKYVQIELNNSCNAHCVMCNIPNMTRKKGQMTDELFVKILKEANAIGAKYITPFLHGEPFLRADYIEKLAEINKYAPNAKITIFTNASLLDVDTINRLSKIVNIEQIVFSFPGGNKKTYEEVTGLDYDSVIKNIKNAFLVLENIDLRISMPICNENKDSYEDFYTLWKGYPCSTYETYNYLADMPETLSNECFEQCDRAFRSMTILFDGRICLCCMDSDGKYILGDVSDETMLNVWNNSQYKTLRYKHGLCRLSYEPCAKCTQNLNTEEYKNANHISNS